MSNAREASSRGAGRLGAAALCAGVAACGPALAQSAGDEEARRTARQRIDDAFRRIDPGAAVGALDLMRVQQSGVTALEEISVEGSGAGAERGDGPVQGYRATRSTTATRTDTPLIETPASVTVLPKELIEDRRSQSLAEVLALAPSVARRQNFNGYESFTIRGFFQDQENGVQIDGFRTRNVVTFDPELFERVEVLKGPASLLNGQMEPGGVINFVTARPTATPFGEVGGTFARYDDASLNLDASTSLGDAVAFRLPLVARRYDTFRDQVDNNQYFAFAPTVTAELSDRTTARLFTGYIDQDFVDDTVLIPVVDGKPLDIPKSRFLGDPDAFQKDRLFQTIGTVEHKFSDNLVWRNSLSYIRTTADRNTVANALGGFNPETRELTNLRVLTEEHGDSIQGRTEAVVSGSIGATDHKLLVGLDLNRYTSHFFQNDQILSPIDVDHPAYDQVPTDEGVIFDGYRQRILTKTLGAYVQDQATLIQNRTGVHKLIAVAGLRYDAYKQDYRERGTLFGETQTGLVKVDQDAVLPRLGLVWMPVERISVYGSYSRSLAPQEVISLDGVPPLPQKGEQYEAGVKLDVAPKASVTASLFEITKQNVPRETAVPGVSALTGEQRSRGFEIEAAGEILPGWQIFGGYAYTDAITTKDKPPSPEDGSNVGNQVFNAPKHRASFWSSYTIQSGALKGVGGGAGATYTGDLFADDENTIRLKSFVLVDAALWWRPEAGRLGVVPTFQPSFQVGVKNLFDDGYFLSGNGFSSVTPGTPRTLYASASLKF